MQPMMKQQMMGGIGQASVSAGSGQGGMLMQRIAAQPGAGMQGGSIGAQSQSPQMSRSPAAHQQMHGQPSMGMQMQQNRQLQGQHPQQGQHLFQGQGVSGSMMNAGQPSPAMQVSGGSSGGMQQMQQGGMMPTQQQ
eukprot:scaffold100580_cov46-Prasinocladus_malaysianus.AAC.1